MKKIVLKGMAALFICAAFASCSHETDFQSTHEEMVFENLKNQYSANFIKKYGEIDPNQSWDFSSSTQSGTRAGESINILHDRISRGSSFYGYCKDQLLAIQRLCETKDDNSYTNYSYSIKTSAFSSRTVTIESASATMKTWNNFFAVKMDPSFACVKTGKDYFYNHLGFSYNNCEPIEMIANINAQSQTQEAWYTAQKGNLNHNSGRNINTLETVNASNVYWTAYCSKQDGTTYRKDLPITQYREYKIKVKNDKEYTYWGFDCDGDTYFSDIICLVNNLETPDPIVKRYMIEDLGDTDDTDFNDIVVDFKDDFSGTQTAIIRAMGGTLDFTLNIGGNAVWTKSVDGPKLTPAVNVKDMVNTDPSDTNFTKELAKFTVTGWMPSANNISVTVKYSDKNSVTGYTTYTIPFPKVGQVPMMFATDPIVNWMYERDSFPEWWLDTHSPSTTE